MSGTGQFRNARSAPRAGAALSAAHEHLGDRLAAFVDGELGDDARERVLSHLATCDPCKGEAEEQRRLKNAVAEALPPALSAGLLARLQGLPGCDQSGRGPGGAGTFGRRPAGDPGGLPIARGERRSYLTPATEAPAGFPIHDFTRSASRGRRLAFAAAGAFSLAALALGGALPLDTAFEGGRPADPGQGTASTPLTLNRAGDRHSADPRATPLSANVTEPLLSPGRNVVGAVTGLDPVNPSPSAQQAARPTPDASAVPTTPAPTPTALPLGTPAHTDRSVAPLPLLRGTAPGPVPTQSTLADDTGH